MLTFGYHNFCFPVYLACAKVSHTLQAASAVKIPSIFLSTHPQPWTHPSNFQDLVGDIWWAVLAKYDSSKVFFLFLRGVTGKALIQDDAPKGSPENHRIGGQ